MLCRLAHECAGIGKYVARTDVQFSESFEVDALLALVRHARAGSRLLKPPDRRPRGHYVSFCHCASHVGGNFFATLNAADSSVSKAIFCASMTSPATR